MWNRNGAALQSTLGFMHPVKAEDSLLLYYRQYSMFFLFSQPRFSLSLSLRHSFLHILDQYTHSHGDFGCTSLVPLSSHGSTRPTSVSFITTNCHAKSAPQTWPFFLCFLASVKGSLCVLQQSSGRVQSPKLMHVKQPDTEQKLDQCKN